MATKQSKPKLYPTGELRMHISTPKWKRKVPKSLAPAERIWPVGYFDTQWKPRDTHKGLYPIGYEAGYVSWADGSPFESDGDEEDQ